MANSWTIFMMLFISIQLNAQKEAGLEQYFYFEEQATFTMGPIAHYQTTKNWYAEARYNYEELRTFSFYAGKSFSKEGDFSYAIIPMVGAVLGNFNGGSIGTTLSADYSKVFLSSQMQYTFSTEDRMQDFVFSWSELVYEPCSWLYGGIAIQHTHMTQENSNQIYLGPVIAFSLKNWTLPMYLFNPGNAHLFVLGITWQWEKTP